MGSVAIEVNNAPPRASPVRPSHDRCSQPSQRSMSTDKGKMRRQRAAVKKVVSSDEEWKTDKTRPRANEAEDPLEDELYKVESQLEAMQKELGDVQKEREMLESQRRVLQAVAPITNSVALREAWRGEQQVVQRLQEDNFDQRAQVELLKENLENWRTRAMDLEQKLRTVESSNKAKMAVSKEAVQDQQQVVSLLRQKYAEAQDELDEMRALIEDQTSHLEAYRNKYLLAQQRVEEQKRQMDLLEADQDRITDQVQTEVHRAKAEFEAKLQELAPLPDIVKATQTKLQEERQLCLDLGRELSAALQKVTEREEEISRLRAQMQSWLEERQSMLSHLESFERKCNMHREEVKWYKQGMMQLEEANAHNEKVHEDNTVELARLRAELEGSREQAARQVTRLRDQADTMKRSFESQISELEQQLAHSRAHAAATNKEKDELQQRHQKEIYSMQQDFTREKDRIAKLQSVVEFLKSKVESDVLLSVNLDMASMDFSSRT